MALFHQKKFCRKLHIGESAFPSEGNDKRRVFLSAFGEVFSFVCFSMGWQRVATDCEAQNRSVTERCWGRIQETWPLSDSIQ